MPVALLKAHNSFIEKLFRRRDLFLRVLAVPFLNVRSVLLESKFQSALDGAIKDQTLELSTFLI